MDSPSAFSPQGTLADAPFPLLLVDLYNGNYSGCLTLRIAPIVKKVYLYDGAVIFASSTDHNDRLGEMLIRKGGIRVEEFFSAASKISPGRRFGTILVEMGTLAPHELVRNVKEQVKEIVFSLFPLTHGDYELTDKQDATEEIITLNINTPELIKQGIQRMDRVTMILDCMDDLSLRVTVNEAMHQVRDRLSLDHGEDHILDLLRSPRRISQLLGQPDIQDFEILKLLWALLILQVITPASEVPVPEESAGQDSLEALEFGVSNGDLLGLDGQEASAPPSPEPPLPDALDQLEMNMVRLNEVSRLIKLELGAAAYSFLQKTFDQYRQSVPEKEVPPIVLDPGMVWSGAPTNASQSRVLIGFLRILREQTSSLLPGPTAQAIAKIIGNN